MAVDRGQEASGSSLPAHPAGMWRRDSGLYPMQEFVPLDVHSYHHVSLNWPAHAKLTPGRGINCFCLAGVWGDGDFDGMEDRCVTLKETHKRRDCSGWIMLEGREGQDPALGGTSGCRKQGCGKSH